jgi:hypothetical protein
MDARIARHALNQRSQNLLRVGAIVERGIDVAQVATQLLFSLDEMHVLALLGDRKRRRHAGQPAAHHERAMVEVERLPVERLELAGLGHCHCHQALGLGRRHVAVAAMHPAILLANVGQLKQVRVESSLANCILEQRLVRARRARSDPTRLMPCSSTFCLIFSCVSCEQV